MVLRAALRAFVFLCALSPTAGVAQEPAATTTIGFDARILENLGLELRSVDATAPALPVQYAPAHGFAAVAPWQLELGGTYLNFEHFDAGTLRHSGGFTLRRGTDEISFRDFVLRVSGFDWDVLDAEGNRWLILVHPQQFRTPDGGLALRRADILISPELAIWLGRADLARNYLGEAELSISPGLVALAQQAAAQPQGLAGPGIQGLGACDDIFTGDLDLELLITETLSQVEREAGVRVSVTMAAELENVGDAAIEWNWAISPDSPVGPHPYLLLHFYRIASGRIEQIGRSDVKHAFNATNDDCPCPSGPVFYPGCKDYYGAGTNSNPYHLAPRDELTAFTGAWEKHGSHFDGSPVDTDRDHGGGSDHDDFEHVLVMRESKLQTAGAGYYKEAWYLAGGDVDLWNGMGHTEVVPNLGGGNWTFPEAGGASLELGSILDAFVDPVSPPSGWQRQLLDTGEGRIDFAVRTTDLGGGSYHYEYAMMNFDFDRQIEAFEIPVPLGTTVSNLSFSDVDETGANDWSAVANTYFVRFAAPSGNELDWGTLYSFGFDADQAPTTGSVRLAVLEAGPTSELSESLLAPAAIVALDTAWLSGTAAGGSVDLYVEGVSLSVPTSFGASAATVLADIAAAINSNATLVSLGITADVSGPVVTTNAPITNLVILDAGLQNSIPTAGPTGLLVVALLLALAGALAWRRSTPERV